MARVIVFNYDEGILKFCESDLKRVDGYYIRADGQLYNSSNVCLDTTENKERIMLYVQKRKRILEELEKEMYSINASLAR